jgi:hypothetical protein
MNKKIYTLIAIALVLAGVYAVFFTGWFQPKTMFISSTSRPVRTAQNTQAGPAPVLVYFNLGGDIFSLTDVKVVPLAELQTNKLAQPIWHLVSDEGSDDVDQFFYGEKIRGMDPAVGGAQPEPLQPGVMYRLFVAAGKVKGQFDFHIGPAPADPAAKQ